MKCSGVVCLYGSVVTTLSQVVPIYVDDKTKPIFTHIRLYAANPLNASF